MQNVPSRRLGKELGLKDGDLSDPEDEVEARVRSELTLLVSISRAQIQNWSGGARYTARILPQRRMMTPTMLACRIGRYEQMVNPVRENCHTVVVRTSVPSRMTHVAYGRNELFLRAKGR